MCIYVCTTSPYLYQIQSLAELCTTGRMVQEGVAEISGESLTALAILPSMRRGQSTAVRITCIALGSSSLGLEFYISHL